MLGLSSTLAGATKIPLGTEGQALTVNFQLQTWAGLTQDANPAGDGLGYDFRLRRVRAVISAEPTDKWAFLLQLDAANFGTGQDYSPRFLPQDAWVSYSPTGRSAKNVFMVDAGFLLVPLSRQALSSTTSFTTIDVHLDAVRGFREGPGIRDLGVQVRGWALDKKIGYRGGIYRGVTGTQGDLSAANPRAGLNPSSHPRLGGFVNFNILGTEEGNWLYQGIYFQEKPVVSVGVGGGYQSKAVRGPSGLTDTRVFSGDFFADLPTGAEGEGVVHATAYRNDFGGGSANTGWGYFVDAGYRFGFVMPYASYEGFNADSCPDGLVAPACTADTQNSSIIKAGLHFYINKNANHIDVEYANARSLKPSDADRVNSVLVQWNTVF
ncbi:hypothetical protein FGE12_11265 [Aggregicoccus sp. 17bor-14]|uniref:hypothetical protein n=1 Tax=Myxococcaceae TaxID=31 RepID=UPI00129CCFBD|nr:MULTISPECIES: hypothetical protein [Myxococcaceae]MBF5042969.1 hypothetical protein [Simulacricoccus sp. 17bor-14]MRI88735.1 hypothetical protein [Aggregicoccus sp. 17bor-14]